MARRKTRVSVSARPRRPVVRRKTPTTVLAQTYLERFEAETPRAPVPPSPALEGLVQPAERSPAFAGLAPQQPPQNIFQQFMARLQGPVYPGPSLAEQTRLFTLKETPGVPAGGFGGIFRRAGEEVVQSTAGGLGAVVSGSPTLSGIFGGGPQQVPGPAFEAPLPTLGDIGSRISRRGGPEQLPARRLFTTVSALYRGVRPPMIGFDAQEFLGLTDEEIEGIGYTKVPGGWVRRELWDQPLQNVYGSGTAAQPQTINVNYGGYGGGGGGGTRQQSSYLVNWRI